MKKTKESEMLSYKKYIQVFSKNCDDAKFKELMLKVLDMYETRDRTIRMKLSTELNKEVHKYKNKKIIENKTYVPRTAKWVHKTLIKEGKLIHRNEYDPKFYKLKSWKELRQIVLSLFENKCMCCQNNNKLNVDHVKPRCNYPNLELELTNLQILCEKCNFEKGSKTIDYRNDDQIKMLSEYKKNNLMDKINNGKLPPMKFDYFSIKDKFSETSKIIIKKKINEEIKQHKEINGTVYYKVIPCTNKFKCFLFNSNGVLEWDGKERTKEEILEVYCNNPIINYNTKDLSLKNQIHLRS